MQKFSIWLLRTQAIYFGLTGLWPLLHVPSFMDLTGPKHDIWLLKTVGILVFAIAIALFIASYRAITPEIVSLGALSAAGLAFIDIFYVATSTISQIYLMDAVIEIVFTLSWAVIAYKNFWTAKS